MKRFFKSIFGASSKEVNGVIILITIFMLSMALPAINRVTTTGMGPVSEEDAKILDSLVAYYSRPEEGLEKKFSKFKFNPNQVSASDLLLLGFDERTVQQIVNYRAKGGEFRIKQDLYKIYSIDSVLVDSLYAFISLPDKSITKKRVKSEIDPIKVAVQSNTPAIESVEIEKFDLNEADTSMLQTINGIGSVLSNRIISFRDKLGGFYGKEQLYEVYNLDSTVVEKLLEVARLDQPVNVKLLRINRLTIEELASHPYLSKKQARLIVAYRNQHGHFESENDLQKVYLVNDYDISRLKPYLNFN